MLEILDLSDNMLGLLACRIKVKPHVLRLRYDIALPRELGDQHALFVSDLLRFDMLVRSGIAQDRRNVDASLMGEGGVADIRLVNRHVNVGDFADIPCGIRQRAEVVVTDALIPELQLQIRNDGAQVGVPASFTVSVHRSLYMPDTGLHGA